MDMLARHGMTIHEFATLQQKIEVLRDKEIDDWNDYIVWSEEPAGTYTVYTSDGSEWERPWGRKRNSITVKSQRREEYYKSAHWAYIRNIVLESFDYQCAGCGGVATQAHHDGHNEKHGNYAHIGKANKQEINCLVPVCHRCHMVITNIQNKKRWRTKIKPEKVVKSKPTDIFNEVF